MGLELALECSGADGFRLQLDCQLADSGVTAVCGPSGSGKSSLIGGIVEPALRNALNRAEAEVGDHDGIEGLEHLDKTIAIDQSPIGRTPRSNPAHSTSSSRLSG